MIDDGQKFGTDTIEKLIPLRLNQVTISPHPTSISIRMTDPGPSRKGKGRIAYLGPEGTYGQQVRSSLHIMTLEIEMWTYE